LIFFDERVGDRTRLCLLQGRCTIRLRITAPSQTPNDWFPFPAFGSSAEMPLGPTQVLIMGTGGCHTALMMMKHRQHDTVLQFPAFGSSAEMPLDPTQVLVIGPGGWHTALMMMKHCQHRHHATEVKQHAASANHCPILRTG
jgi:hypothetical protein